MNKLNVFFEKYLNTLSHMSDALFVAGGKCNW